MFEFAKYFLGPVYFVTLVAGFTAAGPVSERSKSLGIAVLLIGLTVSMHLAGAAKLRWEREIEDPRDQEWTE